MGRRILLLVSFLLLTIGCARGQVQNFGTPIFAMGPGVLPFPGTPLQEGYARFAGVVCVCGGGYAQNWVYWQRYSNCSPGGPDFPAIAVFDETTGQQLCPPVTPGMSGTARLQNGNHFNLTPLGPKVGFGDLLAVEVTTQGTCNGESSSPFQTGGEIWATAVLAPAQDQCPPIAFATPIPAPTP